MLRTERRLRPLVSAALLGVCGESASPYQAAIKHKQVLKRDCPVAVVVAVVAVAVVAAVVVAAVVVALAAAAAAAAACRKRCSRTCSS